MSDSTTESPPIGESIVEEILARACEGFNAHDPDRFLAVMTEDVVIDHSAWPTPLRGRAAARTFYSDFIWTAFPDLQLEREDGPFLHQHAPRFAFAWRVIGTHRGRIDPPGFAATGKTIALSLREIAEVHEGRVRCLQVQFDMAELLRQIGVLPAAHSRAERALASLQRLQTKVVMRRR